MANKKYIAFDTTNEEDNKIIVDLNRISLLLEKSSKEVIKTAIESIKQSEEYKQAVKKLLSEIKE